MIQFSLKHSYKLIAVILYFFLTGSVAFAAKPFIEVTKKYSSSDKDTYFDEIDFYELKPTGFPEGTVFKMTYSLLGEDFIDANWPKITSSSRTDILSSFLWSAEGLVPGQQMTIRFQSTDRKYEIEKILDPFPLEFVSKKGRISAKVQFICPYPTAYIVFLSGISPDESYTFTSVVGHETIKQQVKGETRLYLMPDVNGLDNVMNKVSLKFTDGDILSFSVPVKNAIKNHAQLLLEKGISKKTGEKLSPAAEAVLRCSCDSKKSTTQTIVIK